MTISQTKFRKIRERGPEEISYTVCPQFPEEPLELDPVHLGGIQWLRDQARQAELNPEREWNGLQAEWDLLVSGKHPDPHPDRIIYGKDLKRFKPRKLIKPKEAIFIGDHTAYENTMSGYLDTKLGYPAKSQQLYAAHCRLLLDFYLSLCINPQTGKRFEAVDRELLGTN